MENLELYLSIFASIASLLTYLRGENTRKLIVKSNSNKLTQSGGQNTAYQAGEMNINNGSNHKVLVKSGGLLINGEKSHRSYEIYTKDGIFLLYTYDWRGIVSLDGEEFDTQQKARNKLTSVGLPI